MKKALFWTLSLCCVSACGAGGGARPAPSDASTLKAAPPDKATTESPAATAAPAASPADAQTLTREDQMAFKQTVDNLAGMASNAELQAKVQKSGLKVVDVQHESRVGAKQGGPNPAKGDFSFEVEHEDPATGTKVQSVMPVIRLADFDSRKAVIPVDRFFVRVGNQRGQGLSSVALTQLLGKPATFASSGDDLGIAASLLSARDNGFDVAAQAVFLPVPKKGTATFTPVLFPADAATDSAAALTIVVTRQGTSMRVVQRSSADKSDLSGVKLTFNASGQSAPFTAERKSDVEERIAAQGGPKTEDDRTALARGADVLFLIQIPLKKKEPPPVVGGAGGGIAGIGGGETGGGRTGGGAPTPASAPPTYHEKSESDAEAQAPDVENAVLGHGATTGAYVEGDGSEYVRDSRYPIRIVVQFYRATSNPVLSDADLDAADIATTISSVYQHANAVGSLLVPKDDPSRPKDWAATPAEWFPW